MPRSGFVCAFCVRSRLGWGLRLLILAAAVCQRRAETLLGRGAGKTRGWIEVRRDRWRAAV